ncbi:MAG: pyrroline-5-carboxylate reductase [Woeseiaceae bacterium]
MSDNNESTIGFIGGGNMTLAIAGGLLASDYPADRLCISEPASQQQEILATSLPGVDISTDNTAIAGNVDCLVLATKPQVLSGVCRDLAESVQQRKPLVISIAAGVRGADIDNWLGGGLSIVRVMPNQPALLRMGASGLFANAAANDSDRKLAASVIAAVGEVVWVETEADIDTVTAVSGSGPAYFFLLIDMLARSAVDMGLNQDAGLKLAVQTALGAAAMAEQTDDSMDELIERVRSPGGTTAAALDSLDQQNVRAIFSAAVAAARQRANELADEAGR